MRRRQEKHIRWLHLSLTALDTSISSERQVTHSTLHGILVSRDESGSSVDGAYRLSTICFLTGSAFLTGSGFLAGSSLTDSGFLVGLGGPMKAPNTPEDRSPAFPGLALGGLRSMLRSVRDTTGAGPRSDVKIPEDRSPALPGLVLDGLRSIFSSVRGSGGGSLKIELNMPDDRSPALAGRVLDGLRSLLSSTRGVTGAA